MKTLTSIQTHTISYYKGLLQRYARRMIHDETIAEKLVKQALEDQFHIDGLAPSKNLRKTLKFDVLNHCYYYKYSKIFDRPLLKTSPKKFTRFPESNEV